MSSEDWDYMNSFVAPGSRLEGALTLANVLKQISNEERRMEFCRHFKLAYPLVKVRAVLNRFPCDDPT